MDTGAVRCIFDNGIASPRIWGAFEWHDVSFESSCHKLQREYHRQRQPNIRAHIASPVDQVKRPRAE